MTSRPASSCSLDPQQRGVELGLRQLGALGLPLRPELLGLGQPGGLGQAAGNGGVEHRANESDPLWRLRHALTGLGLALLASVFVAAGAGRVLGDLLGDSYGTRVTIYGLLLLYVVIGAVVLFVRVAQHETRPVSAGRVLRWLASLWLWPALLVLTRRATPPPPPPP
jgi:MFS family permease